VPTPSPAPSACARPASAQRPRPPSQRPAPAPSQRTAPQVTLSSDWLTSIKLTPYWFTAPSLASPMCAQRLEQRSLTRATHIDTDGLRQQQ